jgi:RNA polymerase sigma factor (sigma-70 family)
MSDVTQILSRIDAGDPSAAESLLPLVYDELRKLAAAKLAHEKPGQTLQATALVHEAYLRLVGPAGPDPGVGDQEPSATEPAPGSRFSTPAFNSRGHFFAAAAEAMRRILVEQARRKGRLKRGGDRQRVDLDQLSLSEPEASDDVLAIHEALTKLEAEDARAAQLVKLRFFAGMSLTEAADALGMSRTSAYDEWAYVRAWLRCAVEEGGSGPAN